MVILVAVQQQDAGGRGLSCGRFRRVQLVQKIADVGLDPALGDRNGPVSALDAVGGKHTAENKDKQQDQCNYRISTGVVHKNVPLFFGYTTDKIIVPRIDANCNEKSLLRVRKREEMQKPMDWLYQGVLYDCRILVVSGSGSNHWFLPKRMMASPTSTVSKISGMASTGMFTQPWLPPLT